MQISMIYAGVPMEVTGDYIPRSRGSQFEPPEGAFIEDMSVKVEGHDITEILADSDMVKIEALAIGGMR